MPVFLSPLGGLVAIAALLPLGAALVRERRLRPLRRTLGIARPTRGVFATALAGAAAVALLALAAAQPALSRNGGTPVRTDAQAYAVFDTSRSMLAVRHRHGRSRFARARDLALRLNDVVPNVPWGVASFSDRTLLALFPTSDRALFAGAVSQSVGVGRPAAAYRERNVTALQTLDDLGGSGFFVPTARDRIAVVFTDGETQRLNAPGLAARLAHHRIHLLVVRLWSRHDRVYDTRGRDSGYRPDPASATQLARLRRAGIPVVSNPDAGTVATILRRWLGRGPTAAPQRETELVPLAPAAILAAILPLGFVFVRSRR